MNWIALFLLVTAPMRIYQNTTLPPNGVYRQPVYIMADNITLDCRGSSFIGNKIGVGLLIQNRKGVTIRNCKFHNWDVGGYVVSGNQFVFENNDWSNNYVDDNYDIEHLKPIPHGGLILNGIQNSRVIGNKANNNIAGIQILNSSRILVERNTTSHNRGWGIYLYGTTASRIISNTVEYCNRSCPQWGKDAGCGAAGIVLTMQSDRNQIGWNQLHHNGNGIYQGNLPATASNDNEILYNTISHSVANGIEATFSFRNYIHHNTMTNDNYGAWLGYAQYVRFEHNVIKGARVNSVEHHNAQFSTYAGNTFEGANVLLKPHADPRYQPLAGLCQANKFDATNKLINAKFIATGCQ